MISSTVVFTLVAALASAVAARRAARISPAAAFSSAEPQ
jgi:ABC-type antimicrobial peptide transport system permease subunit